MLGRRDAVHHASATPVNITASRLAKLRGMGRTQHIYTISVEPHDEDPYFREVVWSIKNCDLLVAGSNKVALAVKNGFGRLADVVITNGVDLKFFDPATAGEGGLAEIRHKPFVLFVSALLPRKRADILMRIAARMPDLSFVVVGRPSAKTGGDAIVERLKQHPNIHYWGFQPKRTVRDLMAHASAFIFPSDLEGYANVLLEASAMGLPILARPVSSMPEIVEVGVNGWLLEAEPITQWVSRIREIVEWPVDKRRNFQAGAREWSHSQFSWDAVAEKLKDFYLAHLD
jgi:glycosyltransferase involved in cell wall biosynthesis